MTDLARRRLGSREQKKRESRRKYQASSPERPPTRERLMLRNLAQMSTDDLHLHFTYVVDEIRSRHMGNSYDWHVAWMHAAQHRAATLTPMGESEARRRDDALRKESADDRPALPGPPREGV